MRTISSVALSALVLATQSAAATTTVPVTPHDSYSSSVGVLGCKINTNRVAYWPSAIDCNNICVSLTYSGRSVYLLRIDQSGGAHDVSYDAWNYLITGKSATDDPTAGGAVDMETENVDVSKCSGLINTSGSALPLSAANSMNYLNMCLEEKAAGNDSWVGDNYILYNIADPICTYGHDEKCTLADWPTQNQATCPHTLGDPVALTSDPVYNIRYPTGEKVVAGSSVSSSSSSSSAASSTSAGLSSFVLLRPLLLFSLAAILQSL